MSSEHAAITSLKGVGPAVAEKLKKLGIRQIDDLLFHLPLRYEDRTTLVPLGRLGLGDKAQIEGEIVASDIVFGRRRSLVVIIQDASGVLRLRFFHFSKSQQQQLKSGTRIRCFGEARRGPSGLEMYHPEYQLVSGTNSLEATLTPVYPVTEGLNQSRLRSLIRQALIAMENGLLLPELLDRAVLNHPIAIADAIRIIHQPSPVDDIAALLEGRHPAQQRLAFEELLAQRLGLRLVREQARTLRSHAMVSRGSITKAFLQTLGFKLTGAQQRVCEEITADMTNSWPMLRLLQGDVGSGKTVVAALTALLAVENDFQAAIMAPTEILAEQHFLNFSGWLTDLGITCAWLSGRVKGRKRQEQLELIESGRAQIVIGTHALFQEDVAFQNLGVIIIDEQHRFGVHQRLALKEKGRDQPHQLVMTATPIPRTLTMSLYADMDCSIIDELPPGRTPVTTSVIPESRREQIIERVRAACLNGAQAYWVCTLIEESEVLQCQAAEATAAMLTETLPELKIGLIHGRMSGNEKTNLMDLFKRGEIQLLVATTVIEVGVDVPNASLMIIENPERLGLAQLHQLRGRVGRGKAESFCVLLYQTPLGETSRRRLNVLRESSDGFTIAEEDLNIRGPGEILGSRQAGAVEFKIADFARDAHLMPMISTVSEQLLNSDPEMVTALIRRWVSNAEVISQV